MTTIHGLSESEVVARRQRGEGNDVEFATSRSYADIIRHNVLNFFNIVLFSIGGILLLLGRLSDALTSTGLVAINVIIGTIQEIRTKRKLDEIALLTRPRVTVIREGQEKSADPAELVRGDILVIRPGDQMVVDGKVVGDGKVEMDESLLTGESDLIPKHAGNPIYSGSFCVTGTAMYEAQKVGAESLANRLTANARAFQVSLTPLQKEIHFVIRLLMLVALFYGFLLLFSALVYSIPIVRNAQMAAVILGLVPNGLFLAIIISYSLAAVRLAGQGVLVQQANAIESLSHINVLCTDKTGTLTANRINYHDVYPVNVEKEVLEHILADFASSASVTNRTSEAITEALGGQKRPVVDEVAFSSARKWSALAFDPSTSSGQSLRGVYVLGAMEMLQPYLPSHIDLSPQARAWSDEGLRVLLLTYNPDVTRLHDGQGEPNLPPLTPLGLLSFSDELRPQVKETIAGFMEAGVQLKVISGDNPNTVAALARQAGLPRDLKAVSGLELAEMSEVELAQVAEEATIFGRITPEQKEKLIDALRQRDHHVAMIGDGVNDVLSLKKANVGIAMQSGSSATRGVADMVLLNDSFTVLLPAFLEGQRIVNGMSDILCLFFSQAASLALLIAALAIMSLGFPTVPAHSFLYSSLTVGLPILLLAVWARPAQPKRDLLRSALPFSVPAATLVMVIGLIIFSAYFFGVLNKLLPIEVTREQIASFEMYTGYPLTSGNELKHEVARLVSRTALTTFTVLAGIVLVMFVAPPIQFFVAGKKLSEDKRPALLAIGLLLIFIVVVAVKPLRDFFELVLLRPVDYLVLGLAVVLWALVLRFVWRAHLFERFLGLEIAT